MIPFFHSYGCSPGSCSSQERTRHRMFHRSSPCRDTQAPQSQTRKTGCRSHPTAFLRGNTRTRGDERVEPFLLASVGKAS